MAAPQVPDLGGPTGRFGSNDIYEMIKQMGATGTAADELFKQFSSLEGYRNTEISNAPGATASGSGIGGGYGCWCYFGDDHAEYRTKGVAKGPPLDDLDKFCHDLWRGYECVLMDLPTCTPWDIDYRTTDDIGSIGNTAADITEMCRLHNTDTESCQFLACTVEAWFLKQIDIANGAEFGITSSMIDPLFKHNHADWENFRREQVCVGDKHEDEARNPVCCGTWPERVPFNANAPNKVCCTDNTGANNDKNGNPSSPTNVVETYVHNTASEQCCANGLVLPYGEAC